MRASLAIVLLAVPTLAAVQENGAEKPKYTIKEVMKKAHSSKLINKVLVGEASQEEKTTLLDLYLSLPENKPPKGDQAAWNARTAEVVTAAAWVVVDRENAIERLKQATNCAACHKAHRGK